jgi:thiol-disulfide isomerase/thioredoxin
MRYFILIFLNLFFFSLGNAQHIYEFQLETSEGQVKKYSELKGEELTVVDFWATWCKPCVNSIPKLVEISDEYSEKGVKFIGISIDSPRNLSKIRPFAESIGINYPVLLDLDQEVLRDFNVSVIPTLTVIDKNNEIVYMHEGFAPGDESEIRKELDRLLNGHE